LILFGTNFCTILRPTQYDSRKPLVCLVLAVLLLNGCRVVGPNYSKPPSNDYPPDFKESDSTIFKRNGEGNAAQPSNQAMSDKWWELFGDSQLNAFEEQIDSANQTLKAADANYLAARANIGLYRAALAPTLSIGPSIGAVRDSINQPYFNSSNANNGEGSFVLPIDLSYEVDLWGSIHRSVTAARESAQASDADLEAARLSLHAELAIDYFDLRADDAQAKLLSDTVGAYQQALRLTEDRYTGGAAPLSDVTQARTQLQAVEVQDSDVRIERAQFEHSIAVLTGQATADLKLGASPLSVNPPTIPIIHSSLPSQLLERRPDIAGAERRVAAANEQIGIAEAAYYPTLDLSALVGFNSNSLINLLSFPSRFFAVGSSLNETLYDHGRRRAGSGVASAQYDTTVANYRETVLAAFQQVEDALVAVRVLKSEADQQRAATESAEQSLNLLEIRYEGGVDTYLQVVASQTAALANQRNDIEISRRRLEASILLIKALGGGWTTAQIPKL
jgi:NodT family efflux transporter outer membrane factor (OMF) lipoprotein